jgi:hypothetical protein
MIWDMGRNLDLIEQYKHDPESVLSRYDLSAEERTAITNHDALYLYNLGIHPQLLSRGMTRMLGMPQSEWKEAIVAGQNPGLATTTSPGPARKGEELLRNYGSDPWSWLPDREESVSAGQASKA